MNIISLNSQIQIYSVDTSAFYNDAESKLQTEINNLRRKKRELEKINITGISYSEIEELNRKKSDTKSALKVCKENLYDTFQNNDKIRELNPNHLVPYKVVSIFDSVLTRTLGLSKDTLYEDIIIVQTYFFDVIKSIIINGFYLKGEKYIFFTASAGQIRTKKTVFIKEKLFLQHQKSLMCGLTLEKINEMGGVNVNKYLAYLALCNSATDKWNDFDITKTIVVDDMETMVTGEVDFIDETTYTTYRKIMDIPINHTDGCGMMLPKVSRKNCMVRLPWVKGLLVSFPFDKFIREANKKNPDNYHGMITDIYGIKHDIIKEGIEIIFTKSQFKMYKYYNNWNEYTKHYVNYSCQAGICNIEEEYFENAKLNYQMLQTLSDITDEELNIISTKTIEKISNIATDRDTMLKVFGVTKGNKYKSNYQQALELYPELLSDIYSKEILKQIKKSLVRESRAGKIDVRGKYTFIVPDLYAFCEWLFLGSKSPNGLLKDGQVFCKLYKNNPKLDCLRSPHLYREHAIRENIVDNEKKKWFTTCGLYTSSHDLMSKMLQFDCDGDKSLVCADTTIIAVASRNMKNIVPLYYNMAKAQPVDINNSSMYNGLKAAYTGGNIGMISNDITKIWNSNNPNLDVIKLLCMENNFTIDYAKTLFKPIRPPHIKKQIIIHTKYKIPHFFIYAKNKDRNQVEKPNGSPVNRLATIIPNTRMSFDSKNLGKFNYMVLMNNPDAEINEEIIKKYIEFSKKHHFLLNRKDTDSNNYKFIFNEIKKEFLKINNDATYVADVLVKYLYFIKKSKCKEILWICFGETLVDNLHNNLEKGYTLCNQCGKRVEKKSNRKMLCNSCFAMHRKEYLKLKKREQRKTIKSMSTLRKSL